VHKSGIAFRKEKHYVEIEERFLAPCGLYCGVCGVYYATRDNNTKFLEKLLDFYKGLLPGSDKLTVEDLKCQGCLSDKTSMFCSVCEIKKCVSQYGFEGCHQCSDFPCKHIEDFPVPVGKKVILRATPYWSEHGTEKWVESEEARYVCPECGNKLFRGAQRCNKCKVEVDLD
jgi:hypothetical protein